MPRRDLERRIARQGHGLEPDPHLALQIGAHPGRWETFEPEMRGEHAIIVQREEDQ